ncbi:MAG: tetratricopeptide repeat protein [Gammaproteobacteria bacterium]
MEKNLNECMTVRLGLLLLLLSGYGCGDPLTAEQAFAEGEYDVAYPLWRDRAVQGEAGAQNYLGVHYYMGLGVERDLPLALKWFTAAAKQGDPEGQRHLGMMYHNGYATGQDFVSAYMWYYAAYRQGNPGAKRYMDSLSEENKLSPNQMNQAKGQAAEFIINAVVTEQGSEGKLFQGQQAKSPF